MYKKIIYSFIFLFYFSLFLVAQPTSSDFIFPKSNSEKLNEIEITDLPKEKLALARNEIFARKGHIFSNSIYKKYFSTKKWYKPTTTINTNQLNSIEQYNINLIIYFEEHGPCHHASNIVSSPTIIYKEYEQGKIITIDLNGDGKKESILYSQEGTLTINNITIKNELGNLLYSFAIVDIDKSDLYKEIIISSTGPSDDYYSSIYYFDGKKIIPMIDEIGGLFESIYIDGAGKINTSERASILQTWWLPVQYKLSSEHKIIKVSKEIYPTNYYVFVKKSIKLFTEKNSNSKTFNLVEGQTIKIIGTDNKQWCWIEINKNKKGWLLVNEYSTIGNENLNAQDFFIGLCYAD